MPRLYRSLFTAASAVALAAFVATSVLAQAPSRAPQPQKDQATSIQGDLLRVDPEGKTVTIQPSEGPDQQFKYTDDTKVVGGDKGVAGLATMKGSRVTITFKNDGKDRVATQIEVHPRTGN